MDNYLRAIDRTISIYGNLILRNLNIVAVGRGNKRINGEMIKNRPTLTIFVEKKLANSAIEKNQRIPKYIKGIETDVYERKINSRLEKSSDEKLIADLKPAFGGGGIAIGKDKVFDTSTLTYAFTNKGIRDKLYALTSAHTFEEEGNPMKLGGPVFYFREDSEKGFEKAWELGKLVQCKTRQYKKNDIDAALIYVGENNPRGKNLIAPGLLNGKIITETHVVTQDDINKKEKVYKIGLSTGYIEGEILTIKTMKKVYSPNRRRVTTETNLVCTNEKCESGHSGALGIMKRTGKAFGMHNSGTEDLSNYSEIDTVLKAFDIEFLM